MDEREGGELLCWVVRPEDGLKDVAAHSARLPGRYINGHTTIRMNKHYDWSVACDSCHKWLADLSATRSHLNDVLVVLVPALLQVPVQIPTEVSHVVGGASQAKNNYRLGFKLKSNFLYISRPAAPRGCAVQAKKPRTI